MDAPTYQSTLAYHKLEESQLRIKCDEKVFHKLAPKMDKWREIAIHLKLEKVVTDSVDDERLDGEGKCYRLLEVWKDKLGHKATYELLVVCLLEAGRANLADVVCEALKQLLPCPEGNKENEITTRSNEQVVTGVKAFPYNAQQEAAAPGNTCTRDVPTRSPVETLRPLDQSHVQLRQAHMEESAEESIDHERQSAQEKNNDSHSTQMVATNYTPSATPLYGFLKRQRDYWTKALEKNQEELMQEMMAIFRANEQELKQKEQEATEAKLQLAEEQKKQKDLQEELKQMKESVTLLKENITKKEEELKKNKEEMSEELKELREKLRVTQTELEDKKKELCRESQKVKTLKESVEKAKNEAEMHHKEREKDQRVIKCLKLVEQKHKDTLATYRTILIFVLVLLASLVLFNMGILQ